MRRIRLSSIVGTGAILAGCWHLCAVLIQPLFSLLSKETQATDYLALLAIGSILGIPGVFPVFFGFRLLKDKTKRNIKGTVGAFAVLAGFLLAARINATDAEPSFVRDSSSLIATLCVVPFYLLVSRFVMKKEGLVPAKGEFVGKGIVIIIALEIGQCGFDYIDRLVPIESPLESVRLAPWLVAWLFYAVSTRIIGKNRAEGVVAKSGVEGVPGERKASETL